MQFLSSIAMLVAGSILVAYPKGKVAAFAFGILMLSWSLIMTFATGTSIGALLAVPGLAATALFSLAEPGERRGPAGATSPAREDSVSPAFRLIAALTAAVLAYGLAFTVPLASRHAGVLSFGWYWLLVVALMLLIVSRDHNGIKYGLLAFGATGPSFYFLLSPKSSFAVVLVAAAIMLALAFVLTVLPRGTMTDQERVV